MLFMQFMVYGATGTIISLYLTKNLHFSGLETGTVLAMSSISAFVSPLIGAFVADRFLKAKHLYSLCNFTAGAMMLCLSFQTAFVPVLVFYLLYTLLIGPTFGLITAITFHNSTEAREKFGNIRLWGTIGWITIAWALSGFWALTGGHDLVIALRFGGIAAVMLSFYGLTLPQGQAMSKNEEGFLPIKSLKVLIKKEVLVLAILNFFVVIIDRFYFFGTAPFLKQLGWSEQNIMPSMSIGQFPEIFAIGMIGFLLRKFGTKMLLLAGLLMEFLRFFFYLIGSSTLLLYTGLSLHGFTYAFFFVTSSIYLDSHCDKESRTGVHQLFSIISMGFASFAGNLIAGKSMDLLTNQASGSVNYQTFWMLPVILSVFVFVLILIIFPGKKATVSARLHQRGKSAQ